MLLAEVSPSKGSSEFRFVSNKIFSKIIERERFIAKRCGFTFTSDRNMFEKRLWISIERIKEIRERIDLNYLHWI